MEPKELPWNNVLLLGVKSPCLLIELDTRVTFFFPSHENLSFRANGRMHPPRSFPPSPSYVVKGLREQDQLERRPVLEGSTVKFKADSHTDTPDTSLSLKKQPQPPPT